MLRRQPKYPDEEAARLAVRQELEWVESNVKNKSDGVATGIRDVDDCQPFVMTAPGPGQEDDAIGKQREFGPVFLCSCLHLDLYEFDIPSTLVYESADGSILRHA